MKGYNQSFRIRCDKSIVDRLLAWEQRIALHKSNQKHLFSLTWRSATPVLSHWRSTRTPVLSHWRSTTPVLSHLKISNNTCSLWSKDQQDPFSLTWRSTTNVLSGLRSTTNVFSDLKIKSTPVLSHLKINNTCSLWPENQQHLFSLALRRPSPEDQQQHLLFSLTLRPLSPEDQQQHLFSLTWRSTTTLFSLTWRSTTIPVLSHLKTSLTWRSTTCSLSPEDQQQYLFYLTLRPPTIPVLSHLKTSLTWKSTTPVLSHF